MQKDISFHPIIPNLYINYERTFETGLKFADQNGNRFVTLGSYLLYKID